MPWVLSVTEPVIIFFGLVYIVFTEVIKFFFYF